MRTSHPTLVAAGRAMSSQRDAVVSQWSTWLGERATHSRSIDRQLVERQLGLILDVLITQVGPLRRETKTIWARVTRHYGRLAATRGLAAGEVVDEMQYLRELLIRFLAPSIAALRPRQGMALLLRLNRLVDRGVGQAVVGYTDALVQSMLPPSDDGPPREPLTLDPGTVGHELTEFADALAQIVARKDAR